MKPLIYCDTYYQLFVAIQLKLTLFKDIDVGLCLSDHSVGAKEVVKRLETLRLFDRVILNENLDALKGSIGLKKIAKFIEISFLAKPKFPYSDYDTLVFYNISYAVYETANAMCSKGCAPRLFRMEEGLASCENPQAHDWRGNIKLKLLDDARKYGPLSRISHKVEGFFCFIPELCGEVLPYKTIAIPSLTQSKDELTAILKNIFEYKDFGYNEKYIYFASSQDIDGTPIGEVELILKLAAIVGVDNLVVKVHPRDARSVYKEAGLTVMEGSNTPWEVVQLCEDLSDRVLLSCTSGAPLAITALLDEPTKVNYIEPEQNSIMLWNNYVKAMIPIKATLEELKSIGKCQNVEIKSLDDLVRGCESESVYGILLDKDGVEIV